MKEPPADNRYYFAGRLHSAATSHQTGSGGQIMLHEKGISLHPETIITGGIAEKPRTMQVTK
jgi:hypothetical protein